jgi:hypothetical protein
MHKTFWPRIAVSIQHLTGMVQNPLLLNVSWRCQFVADSLWKLHSARTPCWGRTKLSLRSVTDLYISAIAISVLGVPFKHLGMSGWLQLLYYSKNWQYRLQCCCQSIQSKLTNITFDLLCNLILWHQIDATVTCLWFYTLKTPWLNQVT